jgi:hypothetical protein
MFWEWELETGYALVDADFFIKLLEQSPDSDANRQHDEREQGELCHSWLKHAGLDTGAWNLVRRLLDGRCILLCRFALNGCDRSPRRSPTRASSCQSPCLLRPYRERSTEPVPSTPSRVAGMSPLRLQHERAVVELAGQCPRCAA